MRKSAHFADKFVCDILFVGMGFTKDYAASSEEVKKAMGGTFASSGLAQTEETLEWIWSNFSAAAANSITFEYWSKSMRVSATSVAAHHLQHLSKSGIYMMYLLQDGACLLESYSTMKLFPNACAQICRSDPCFSAARQVSSMEKTKVVTDFLPALQCNGGSC